MQWAGLSVVPLLTQFDEQPGFVCPECRLIKTTFALRRSSSSPSRPGFSQELQFECSGVVIGQDCNVFKCPSLSCCHIRNLATVDILLPAVTEQNVGSRLHRAYLTDTRCPQRTGGYYSDVPVRSEEQSQGDPWL